MPGLLKFESLEDLLTQVELSGVVYRELRARRLSGEQEDFEQLDLPMGIAVRWSDDHSRFAVVFRADLELPYIEITVETSPEFSLKEPAEVPDSVMGAFLEDVAFDIAYPYIRQAVSMLAAQLQVKLWLPHLSPPKGSVQRIQAADEAGSSEETGTSLQSG
jgi:hypothetical protein